ncbi:ATP-dependent DNA helicase II subunit 1 [Fusarium oxysporum f. sp. albedinis]|nr:ATP-dependent DNA helicase II subunit 1 [Fusarium oxysporum f. sp. albedinis]
MRKVKETKRNETTGEGGIGVPLHEHTILFLFHVGKANSGPAITFSVRSCSFNLHSILHSKFWDSLL